MNFNPPLSHRDTICGVLVRAFAKPPTPEELGAIVAHMNSKDQALFFSCLAQSRNDCCGAVHIHTQIAYIASDLASYEEEVLDGKASEMLRALASDPASSSVSQ